MDTCNTTLGSLGRDGVDDLTAQDVEEVQPLDVQVRAISCVTDSLDGKK